MPHLTEKHLAAAEIDLALSLIHRVTNERDRARELAAQLEARLAAVEAVCYRQEKWPIDDDLAGFAPIDEIREAMS